MQSTMAPVTAVSDRPTERSYLETLGELGFLKTIHPTQSLVQNSCQLALQASSLNVVVASIVAFLIYQAPLGAHQLLSQESLLTAVLAAINLFFSTIAIRAVLLSKSFDDATCQVVAADVAMGESFTALITIKPKSTLFAKGIEVELVGSPTSRDFQSALSKPSGTVWRTSTSAPDSAVLVAQNLILRANEEYKFEQQLLIPQSMGIALESRNVEKTFQNFQWWVALKVKRSFILDYECRFPLSVLPQD